MQANGLDLSLFQFDFDLTFAAFFLNADKTIYGRFGTRSDQKDAMREMSMEGFARALEGALRIHSRFPSNRKILAGKRGAPLRYRVPELFPSLKGRFTAKLSKQQPARSCMHCHMVGAAMRKVYRSSRKPIPEDVLFPWPLPSVVGLRLDPKQMATVKEVARGSAAERAGLRSGDQLLSLSGQPLLSIADVQWVLHRTRATDRVSARVRRGTKELDVELALKPGWRSGGDISWRTTTWDLRRMATGGLVLEDLADAQRLKTKLGTRELALLVKHVGQYGEHAVAKRAGFQKGDIIVEVPGLRGRSSETDYLATILASKMRGDSMLIGVLRRGRRLELRLRLQ